MLDRDTLRHVLKDLAAPERPTTLVVTGPREGKCGLTRTADFVEWWALKNGELCANICDPTIYSPYELVGCIEIDLAPADSSDKTAQLVAPYKNRQLASLVRRWIVARDRPCWIILDRLDTLEDDDPMTDLVIALVSALSAGRVSQNARVVLLGWRFGLARLSAPAGAVTDERLDYDGIEREDIEEFVDWVYSVFGNGRLARQTRDQAVERILPDPSLLGPERLAYISERAAALAEIVRREA